MSEESSEKNEEGEASESSSPPAKAFRPKAPIRREAPEDLKRGLNAVELSRAERNKIKRPPLRVAVWFVMTVVVGVLLYLRWQAGQVESARSKLLSKQRGAEQLLAPKWYPIRDSIEARAMELARGFEGDLVDKEQLAKLDFRRQPGIYLRLRVDQATSVESIREGALGSLRDGFTACLMQNENDEGAGGKDCLRSAECDPGQVCNEWSRCAKPGQPYNLRLAYKSLSVLTPEWTKNVQEASNDLMLRGYDLAFEDANQIEFPVAIDLMTKAKFLLLVIDERPAPPKASAAPDGGGPTPEDLETLDGKVYPSRISVIRLADDKPLLRIRREPNFELKGGAVQDQEVAAARLRQAQSCSLALSVRQALGDPP